MSSESSERRRLVVQPLWELFDDAVLVTDGTLDPPGPVIRYVNPAFTRLTGYQPNEVIGRPLGLLRSPRTSADALREVADALRAGRGVRVTLENQRKDGTHHACSLTVGPLKTEEGPNAEAGYFIGVLRDLDGARRAAHEHEQALTTIEDLESRYGEAMAALEAQRAETAHIDARLRAASDRAGQLSELLALRERALDLQRGDAARSEADLRAMLEELRSMDEELRQTMGQLDESNMALIRLNAELRSSEARSADRLRLFAAASHDLRQPVMSLGLFLEVLRYRLGPQDQEIFSGLLASHQSIGNLLDGMLDSARLDAGVLVPAKRPVAMSPLLKAIRDEFAPQAAMRGLRFRVVPCQTNIVSDERLLERILRNLIGNALKYTHRGGILIGCRRRDGRLSIEVRDSGPGISDANQAVIFEEFHQLDNPEGDQRRGVGLGLSIVARLAKKLGHEVGLHSCPGKGALFSVAVPIHHGCAGATTGRDDGPFFELDQDIA